MLIEPLTLAELDLLDDLWLESIRECLRNRDYSPKFRMLGDWPANAEYLTEIGKAGKRLIMQARRAAKRDAERSETG